MTDSEIVSYFGFTGPIEPGGVGRLAGALNTAVNAGAKGILVKTGVRSVESTAAIYTAPTLLEAVHFIMQQ